MYNLPNSDSSDSVSDVYVFKILKINDRMKCGWRECLVAQSHICVLQTSAVLCIVIQIAIQCIIASRLFGM